MTVDPSVVPELLFLLAELVALAAVGYVVVRTALRETDDRVALAQGLVVGPAIWGVIVNLVMYVIPGRAGAIAGWIFVLTLAGVLIWRAPESIRPRLRIAAGFAIAALALVVLAHAARIRRRSDRVSGTHFEHGPPDGARPVGGTGSRSPHKVQACRLTATERHDPLGLGTRPGRAVAACRRLLFSHPGQLGDVRPIPGVE